ncbi:protein kinase PVPK-1 [Prunus yedoensis var. nudiflora]|uniref:Protein kinase PVPK-1 n=1 Tax=Prunus yedoensis var. nudiflora TaxID=2094558 RepID=A0A314Y1N0_PRUYE|nr:protein kinase PVPK-1 [Prunus yedoensis var. nudiflora]
MESLADGVDSLSKTCHSAPDAGNNPPSTTGTPLPLQPPSPKQSRSEGVLSPSCVTAHTYGLKTVGYPNGSVINQKNPNKTANRTMQQEEFLNVGKHYNSSNGGKLEHGGPNDVLHKPPETSFLNKVSVLEAKSSMKNPVDGSDSSSFLESRNHVLGPCKGVSGQKNSNLIYHPAATFCASPQNISHSQGKHLVVKTR